MLHYRELYSHLSDYNRALEEKSYRSKQEAYSKIAADIIGNLPAILRRYPGENLASYNTVLKKYGVNLEHMNLGDIKISTFDIPGILSLLCAATRAEHFSRMNFRECVASGYVIPWLQRLQKLDILNAIEEDSRKGIEFDTPRIHVVQSDITQMRTDCIVNSANANLTEGGEVCVQIYKEAGKREMRKACDKLGYCRPGEAVYTEGFALPAKFVIHAVGPRYEDGFSGEEKILLDSYYSAFQIAEELGCRSIAFPLISSGMKAYPKDEAWRIAIEACNSYLKSKKNPMDAMDIYFAALHEEDKEYGLKCLEAYYNNYWSSVFEKHYGPMDIIGNDRTLSEWCLGLTPSHAPSDDHSIVKKWIDHFDEDCLKSDFGRMKEDLYSKIVGEIGEDYYSMSILAYPETLKLMCPSQLRAAICQYVRAQRYTGNAMYIGAGNGAFSAILNEWKQRSF